jgi:RNA polymerase sigma factor (sigma-70 family)
VCDCCIVEQWSAALGVVQLQVAIPTQTIALESRVVVAPRDDRAARAPVDRWFAREILPLEGALCRYLRRNTRNQDDIEDLRQDVYVRVYDAACKALPLYPKAFTFSTARNLLIDRGKRAAIATIEPYADLDVFRPEAPEATPDRLCLVRDELRQLQAAIDDLPPRCRQVVLMRKIYDLPQREVARRLGITEDTVERQVLTGVRRMARRLYGETMVREAGASL